MWGISKSRLAIIGVIIVLVTTALVAISGVASAAIKVTGAGNVHCTAKGKIKPNRKLTTVEAKTKFTITAALTCSKGETGAAGVTITTGKLSGSIGPITASCMTSNFGPGKGKVTWKATGGSVTSSAIAFTSSNVTDGDHVDFELAGSPTAKGSYVGADAKAHIVGDTTTGGLCLGGNKGVPFTTGPST